jgi:hypothetical protein
MLALAHETLALLHHNHPPSHIFHPIVANATDHAESILNTVMTILQPPFGVLSGAGID